MKMAISRPVLALGIAFSAALMMPQQASAGTNELKAIATQLNGGTLPPGTGTKPPTPQQLIDFIKTKTSLEIANATIAAIQAKPTTAAALAGEALKHADEAGFGDVFGQRLNANQGTLAAIYGTPATKAKFIGTAAKNAATGSAPYSEHLLGFADELTGTNQEAYDAAKSASSSKTAVGLIVASRTLDADIDTDAERLDLAQKALLPKNATTGGQGLSAVQDVARYVSDSVAPADVDAFARNLAATSITVGTKTTQPLLTKVVDIVTGTVAATPSQARNITIAMFDGDNLTTPTTVYLATVKNVSKLATNLGLVADAEEVSLVAYELGQRVGDINPTTKKVVGIKQSSVVGIAKSLVSGLALRPSNASVADNAVRNSRSNRLDEIGEVGAYLLAGIKDLQDFQGIDPKTNLPYTNDAKGQKALTAAAKRAAALVTSLIKTIITASASVHRDIATAPPTNVKITKVKDAAFQQTVADDAAGSIAQTIRSLQSAINGTVFNTIRDALLAATAGTKIGGKTLGPIVQAALISGINGTANGNPAPGGTTQPFHIYEDGTNLDLAQGPVLTPAGNVTEPETDIRTR